MSRISVKWIAITVLLDGPSRIGNTLDSLLSPIMT